MGAEAVKLARQLKPDILLLDLAMPRQPGLEALRELSTGQGQNSVRVPSCWRRQRKRTRSWKHCNWAHGAWY